MVILEMERIGHRRCHRRVVLWVPEGRMVLGFPDLICVCFVCFYCFLCCQISDTKIKSGNEIEQYQRIKEVRSYAK